MDRWVVEQNIRRFREMLRGETNPDRRRELERLLAEEQARMAEIDRIDRRE
jgi:anti-sigma factor RsiW